MCVHEWRENCLILFIKTSCNMSFWHDSGTFITSACTKKGFLKLPNVFYEGFASLFVNVNKEPGSLKICGACYGIWSLWINHFFLGVLLHCWFAAQRGKGLFRDQYADGRDLHEGGVRQREAGGVRAGGGGSRRSTLGSAQLRQPTQLRYVYHYFIKLCFVLLIWSVVKRSYIKLRKFNRYLCNYCVRSSYKISKNKCKKGRYTN